MKILTCEHCLTKVGVDQQSICPSCRQQTTGTSRPEVSSPAENNPYAEISKPVFTCGYVPDTTSNKQFRAASLTFAVIQFASLVRHATTHHTPSGANQLEGLARFAEFFVTFWIALPVLVVGSALGLGAGNSRASCIMINVACCVVAILIACVA